MYPEVVKEEIKPDHPEAKSLYIDWNKINFSDLSKKKHFVPTNNGSITITKSMYFRIDNNEKKKKNQIKKCIDDRKEFK